MEGVEASALDERTLRLTFGGGETVDMQTGQWSDWREMAFGESRGFAQFKLLAFDAGAGEIDLLQSQINRTRGYSNDAELERSILEHSGPFISKWTVPATPGGRYTDTSYEEGEYQAQWLAKTALMLVNEQRADLFATVFRLNDETHHTSLGEYDPSSPFYSAERAKICEETMRRSYEILDRAIGRILREKTEDTTLVLASDHGNVPNVYLCDIYQRLSEFGLCHLDSSGLPEMGRSQAYLKNERGGLEVFVNLKGRESHGIVDATDYERVQTEIFRALTTWYHPTPKGNENVAGMVLKKQDAAMIGYWGEEMGDVIFAYNRGFVWGHNDHRDVVAPLLLPSANHGPQIPTANTQASSNYGIAVFYGRGVRKGTHRGRLAPYRMNDAGATIAKILGVRDSRGIEGRSMEELFQWQ